MFSTYHPKTFFLITTFFWSSENKKPQSDEYPDKTQLHKVAAMMDICLFHSFILQENMDKLPKINKNEYFTKLSIKSWWSSNTLKQTSLSTQALFWESSFNNGDLGSTTYVPA